jgi:hypothetical protein
VGPRALLEAVVKRKIPSLLRESKPRTPIVSEKIPYKKTTKLFQANMQICPESNAKNIILLFVATKMLDKIVMYSLLINPFRMWQRSNNLKQQ